jgi:hypothetical protein
MLINRLNKIIKRGPKKMTKRISLDSVDDKVKKFLEQLKVDEDQYILEIEGKPLMGVVPPWQVGEIRQKKDDLLSMLREVWAKTSGISEDKIEKEVNAAVRAVRKGHA